MNYFFTREDKVHELKSCYSSVISIDDKCVFSSYPSLNVNLLKRIVTLAN